MDEAGGRSHGQRGILTWAAVVALPGSLCACLSCESTGGPNTAPAAVPAMEHPLLQRIPIPDGFRLVPERSVKRESGEVRYATCEYVGHRDLATVSRFYRENMPAAGFTLRQDRFDRGEWIMEFDSSSERSTVRFKRDKLRTRLIIDVSPTPKGSPDRETKPLPKR